MEIFKLSTFLFSTGLSFLIGFVGGCIVTAHTKIKVYKPGEYDDDAE